MCEFEYCRRLSCADCDQSVGSCTGEPGCTHELPSEWYMVHDSVWWSAGMDEGYLCVGCLEQRLGREIWLDDFSDFPINLEHDWDTPRLLARKRAIIEPLVSDYLDEHPGPTDAELRAVLADAAH